MIKFKFFKAYTYHEREIQTGKEINKIPEKIGFHDEEGDNKEEQRG